MSARAPAHRAVRPTAARRSARRGGARLPRLQDYVTAALLLAVVASLTALVEEGLRHWFILPVFLAGVVIGADAIAWFRGRRDAFELAGLLGLFGVHFFFVAPLLHVAWDDWPEHVIGPTDWRVWAGYMAIINVIGLVIYQVVRAHIATRLSQRPMRRRVPRPRLVPLLAIGLVVTAALQFLVYRRFGGLGGYVTAFSESDTQAFRGLGALFSISESFPILLAIASVIVLRGRHRVPSWATIAFVLVVLLVVQLLFGGLRGSRSNTVWALLWSAGMIHYGVRRMSRKVILSAVLVGFVFMYAYGFYKAVGSDVVRIYQQTGSTAYLEQSTGKSVRGVLLHDFARADVQALLLYRVAGESAFAPYGGKTYLGDLATVVPDALWSDKPPSKVIAGTEAQYGLRFEEGDARDSPQISTRIYGLAGEALLNFGPVGAPLAFAALGVFVGWAQAVAVRLTDGDPRQLFLPFLVVVAILLLGSDLDNVVVFAVRRGIIPLSLVWLGTRRTYFQGAKKQAEPFWSARLVTAGSK